MAEATLLPRGLSNRDAWLRARAAELMNEITRHWSAFGLDGLNRPLRGLLLELAEVLELLECSGRRLP